jgi:hypothetical protein
VFTVFYLPSMTFTLLFADYFAVYMEHTVRSCEDR